MYLIRILMTSLMAANYIAINDRLVRINEYCRDKDRLITSDENDEYLLVSIIYNMTIILKCCYW
jgi:hypothetical protein